MSFDSGPNHQEKRATSPESAEALLRQAVENQHNQNERLGADLTQVNTQDPDSCSEALYRVYEGLSTDTERALCLDVADEAGITYQPENLKGYEQLVHLRARPALSGEGSTLLG